MIPSNGETAGSGFLIGACLSHAILVTALWVLVFEFDVEIIPAKIWAMIALMWPLWLVVAAISRSRKPKQWIAAIIASSLVLAPSVPTLYTFVIWAIEGFAP